MNPNEPTSRPLTRDENLALRQELDHTNIPALVVDGYGTPQQIREALAAAGAQPGDRFRLIDSGRNPLTGNTSFYVAWCLTCAPIITGFEYGEMPFADPRSRGLWCKSHTEATGHHTWWILDHVDKTDVRALARTKASGREGHTWRARVAHSIDVDNGWRDPRWQSELPPSGCADCGLPERHHQPYGALTHRGYGYVRPSSELMLSRILDRRAYRKGWARR